MKDEIHSYLYSTVFGILIILVFRVGKYVHCSYSSDGKNKKLLRKPVEGDYSSSRWETFSWLVRICTSFWVYPLILRGYRNSPLEVKDFSENPEKIKENRKLNRFRNEWQTQIKLKDKDASLLCTCWSVWKFDIIRLSTIYSLQQLLDVVNIFAFQHIVELVSNITFLQNNKINSEGIATVVAGYTILLLIKIVVRNLLMLYTGRLERQIRLVFQGMVYSKALRLSRISRVWTSNAKIQSLFSIDCDTIISLIEKIFRSATFFLVKLPGAAIGLGTAVGYAYLPGLLFVIISFRVMVWLSDRRNEVEKKADVAANARMKFTTEVIQSSEAVKAIGWVGTVVRWIEETRNEETKLLWKGQLFKFYRDFLANIRIYLVEFSVISIHVISGNKLNLRASATAGYWLAFLRTSTTQFVKFHQHAIKMKVLLEKIRELLIMPESEELQLPFQATVTADFDNVRLSWYKQLNVTDELKKTASNICMRCYCKKTLSNGDVSDALRVRLAENAIIVNDSKRNDLFRASCSNCTHDSSAINHQVICRAATVLGRLESEDANITADFKFECGKLYCIIGEVGSGKSSIVSALSRGGIVVTAGDLRLRSKKGVGLVSQNVWLHSGTIRENVLFGMEFERSKYIDTLRRCRLYDDLMKLPERDSTYIGENGIKLSGGQRARIAIARAVYRGDQLDMYVLDDSLASLDSVVSQELFAQVLSSETGILKECTRVVVTNDKNLIGKADKIIYLKERNAIMLKNVDDLQEKYYDDPFIKRMISNKVHLQRNESYDKNYNTRVKPTIDTSKHDWSFVTDDENTRTFSQKKKKKPLTNNAKLGVNSFSVYSSYFRKMGAGYYIFPLLLLALILEIGLNIGKHWWLLHWTASAYAEYDQNHCNSNIPVEGEVCEAMESNSVERYHNLYNLRVLGLVIGGYALTDFLVVTFLQTGVYRSAKRMHDEMLRSVLGTNMSFFWNTNTGDIVNRFGSDLKHLQSNMYSNILDVFYSIESACAKILPLVFLIPSLSLLVVPFSFLMLGLSFVCEKAEKSVKRINQEQASPVNLQLSETLDGLDTIHAFGEENAFEARCFQLIARKNQVDYYYVAIKCFRLSAMALLNNSVVIFCLYVIIKETCNGNLSSELAALLLSRIIWGADSIYYVLEEVMELNTAMVHVERIDEYIGLIPEDKTIVASNVEKDRYKCCLQGNIEFKGAKLQYNKLDGVVLGTEKEGFSLNIMSGERVGFVGRTGSGKSTIFRGLLNLVPVCEGSIRIDDINVSEIPRAILRDKVACVTQGALIFSTTLRCNLDPERKLTDREIWNVLEQVGMKSRVEKMNGKLDALIDTSKVVFSFGEKKLISLARALIGRKSIMLFDEATAEIDVCLDAKLQKVIKQLSNVTILTIAHRINTILDYDRVCVLSHGRILECDSPQSLLRQEESTFRALAHAE